MLGMTTKPSKCQFGITECTYVIGSCSEEYVVGNRIVKPKEYKLRTIDQFTQPKTKKKIKFFLRSSGYYYRFITNYATIRSCAI